MFKPNENIVHLLRWLTERYNVFLNKSAGKPFPWTDDEIISSHKFTNVFRFLDYESQFLIRHVIGNDDRSYQDTVFRILLFKIFNYSDTWLYLENELGDITYDADLNEMDRLLDKYVDNGNKVFSSAYLQASHFVQKEEWKYLIGEHKHHQYLTVMGEGILSNEAIEGFKAPKTFEELFTNLSQYDGMGPFMSYQYAQDLNYSKYFNHDMNSFVQEGPGSIRGVKRVFDGVKKNDIASAIKWTYDNLDELFQKYYPQGKVPEFNGHRLTLPDMQNCFCETDKYMRGLGIQVEGVVGKSIKQKYHFANKRSTDMYVAPPKWKVNPLICK